MIPPHIVRIGHIVLAVTDLSAARRFYVDLLGFNIVYDEKGALYLRGVEDREWTLKLELAADAGVKHIAYKAGSEEAVDQLAAFAQEQRLPLRWENERDLERVLRIEDPFGFPVAFYHRSVKHPWLLSRFHEHRGPGIQRIDHVNVLSPQVQQMTEWYLKHWGFRLSEYTEDDDHRMWASWIQRKGNVHDLAITNGAGPRLHHFAFWMPDSSRILLLCDILAGALATDHIERGPGRHGISNAFFLYLRDPDGHRIELYTSDYLTVDPDFEPIRWHLDDPRRQTLWGAPAPRSWFLEGSRVEAFTGGWAPVSESELHGLPSYVA